MTDLTNMTPPQIDELWAKEMEPAYRLAKELANARRELTKYRRYGARYARSIEALENRIAELEPRLIEARRAGDPFDAEFDRRGGWARYLLVANADGHVHRPNCHTLIPGFTYVKPVWELSGQDDEGIVARCGHTACSHCFKDAPAINAAAKAAKDKANNTCRNRMYDPAEFSRGNYRKCSECGAIASLSRSGLLRAHKRKET